MLLPELLNLYFHGLVFITQLFNRIQQFETIILSINCHEQFLLGRAHQVLHSSHSCIPLARLPFPLLNGDVSFEVIDCGNGILNVIQMYEARLQMRFGSYAISLGDKLIEVRQSFAVQVSS